VYHPPATVLHLYNVYCQGASHPSLALQPPTWPIDPYELHLSAPTYSLTICSFLSHCLNTLCSQTILHRL
jgi:hypothetical protein